MGKNRIKKNKLKQAFKYYKPVFGLLFNYKKRVAVIFLCMIFSFVIGFVQPLASQRLIDIGIVEKDFKNLSLMCVILMLLYVIHSLFDYIKEKIRLQIYNNIRFDLEVKTFKHLSSIRIDYFKDKNISSICQTIKEDILSISSIAHSESFEIVSAFLGAVGGGASLLIMEWRLYLLTLVFLPINGFLTFYMMNKNMPILHKYLDKSRDYSEVYGDYINGIKVIRLFGLQRNKETAIRSRADELKTLNMDQSLIRKKNDLIQGLVMNFFSISIYFVSGLIMLKNDISVGKVVAFETYALMLSQPIIVAFSMIFELSALLPSIKRHMELMNYPEEAPNGIDSFGNGDIIFDKVSYSYDGVEDTLSDLSFKIKKGSKTVIWGKNGCGKTTLINMILRLISPDKGEVILGNNNIDKLDINRYRALFGVVSQDVYLFNATLIDNIFLDREIDKERFEHILEILNLKGLVEEKGYEYNVGENGSMLSGGQKQKIALARALITEKPIIILDEATSNLDIETVEHIKKLFNTELKECTVICVTHSEELVGYFDNVIKLH
ncbi:ABC transporter ATP-binding protein [Ruminococcus sp. XPD3002]|uniref:ABC transporter ATP-binding protein n=1 Tax=Ruminococcus sp. XPD3002 TaxID=1452269 RepID=UPI0009183710|nr:ATP-binding cassette, subfamily B, MsbA [Ruminococcus flavefaciens]